MAYSARIDELEKKFSENARRYFAPLANEYRKAGDLDRAIEICRAHLPQQPGHMSGHIVYGQALYESRQLDEAKTVFEAALALDPENLIALRHLGDIARDSADPATARAWYLRVLDADPRNDDVAAMLAELDAAAPAPAATEPAHEEASGWGDINPEHAAGDTREPAVQVETSDTGAKDSVPGGIEGGDSGSADAANDQAGRARPDDASSIALEPHPGDASVDEVLASPPTRSADAEGRQRPPAAAEQPSLDRVLNDAFAAEADTQEMEVGSELASATFASPESAEGVIAPSREAPGARGDRSGESAGTAGDSELAEVDALFDEIASGGASAAGDPASASRSAMSSAPGPHAEQGASADALFGDVSGEAEGAPGAEAGTPLDGLETSEFIAPTRATAEPRKPSRSTGSMAVSGLTSFEQPTEEDSSTRAAFVTETMAELYLQQGFTAEALDIYRQLLEQNPTDANLRDRVAHLEQGGSTSLSVASVSSEVIQAARERHAARPVRTARSFFGRLAGHQVGQIEEVPDPALDVPLDVTPLEFPVGDTTGQESAAEPKPASSAKPKRTGAEIPIVSDLFGDAPVSEADEAAASMLASAFSTAFGAPSDTPAPAPAAGTSAAAPAGPVGRPARAAGNELSLDQVFRESGSRQPRKSGPFSFDQFFSDGSQTPAPDRPPATEQQDGEAAPDAEGDLEQFTAWLEGLKRK